MFCIVFNFQTRSGLGVILYYQNKRSTMREKVFSYEEVEITLTKYRYCF